MLRKQLSTSLRLNLMVEPMRYDFRWPSTRYLRTEGADNLSRAQTAFVSISCSSDGFGVSALSCCSSSRSMLRISSSSSRFIAFNALSIMVIKFVGRKAIEEIFCTDRYLTGGSSARRDTPKWAGFLSPD